MSKRVRSAQPMTTKKSVQRIVSESRIEVIARALIVERSHILLCRNIKHGYHFLPGGHVEFNESATAALERELLEECGLSSTARELLLVSEHRFSRPAKTSAQKARKKMGPRACHELNLVFHVEPRWSVPRGTSRKATSAAQPSLPTVKSKETKIAFDWVDLAALVDLDVRPLSIKAWLMGGTITAPGGAGWLSETATVE